MNLNFYDKCSECGKLKLSCTCKKPNLDMKDVMIDLETLGTSADSIWLSIAAVQFDPRTGQTGGQFYMNVDLTSSMLEGRKISASTLQWWLEQRPEIMKKMLNDGNNINLVLLSFYDWFTELGLKNPWSNSASFDLGILNHSYEKSEGGAGTAPWKYYNEMCYRTVANLAKENQPKKDERLAHDPLYDCLYQIQNLHRVYKLLNL